MKYITNRRGYTNKLKEWIDEVLPSAVVREINPLDSKFIEPKPDEFTIYYTGENDYNKPSGLLDLNYCDDYPVNMRVGFDADGSHENYIRIPLWVLYYNEHSMDYYKETNRDREISLVASHSARRLRSMIADYLDGYGFKVGYFGKFRHNDDFMKKNGDNKALAISHSIFNVCTENSAHEGYITEKLFEALWSGCIPLYWGDPNLEPCVNKDKVILIDPEIPWLALDKVKHLLDNPDELKAMQELPPFTEDIELVVQEYKRRFQNLFLQLYSKYSSSRTSLTESSGVSEP